MSNTYIKLVRDNFEDFKIVSGQFLKSFYFCAPETKRTIFGNLRKHNF